MNKTKVSIITPLHNSGSFIKETIQSIIDQTFSEWELIIIDDNSQDEGPDIVRSFAENDSRIKLISNSTNSGAAITRNKGIKIAIGRYIAFLDSDDLWYPKKLELQLDFMIKNDFPFTYTAYDKITEGGIDCGKINVPEEVTYNSLLRTCSIGCLTAMYDSQKLGKMYMPIIAKRQDYALWLKILKIIPKAQGLNIPLAKYRLRKDSISGNKLATSKFQWKVYREIEGLGLWKSVIYFSFYTWYGVVKTYLK